MWQHRVQNTDIQDFLKWQSIKTLSLSFDKKKSWILIPDVSIEKYQQKLISMAPFQ